MWWRVEMLWILNKAWSDGDFQVEELKALMSWGRRGCTNTREHWHWWYLWEYNVATPVLDIFRRLCVVHPPGSTVVRLGWGIGLATTVQRRRGSQVSLSSVVCLRTCLLKCIFLHNLSFSLCEILVEALHPIQKWTYRLDPRRLSGPGGVFQWFSWYRPRAGGTFRIGGRRWWWCAVCYTPIEIQSTSQYTGIICEKTRLMLISSSLACGTISRTPTHSHSCHRLPFDSSAKVK